MTMISDPDMPAISIGPAINIGPAIEARPANHIGERAGKPSNRRLVGVVVAGVLLITAVNMTAAIYLYRGISDLRFVEGRLEQLGAFEQRIAARLDTVNNGFQSRFEKLDSQLQGSFNEINASIARMEQNSPPVGDDRISSIAEPSVVTTTVAEAPAVIEDEIATEPSVIDMSRPPKRRVAAAAPAPSPNYQRIEQADGKVHYKKIN